MLGHMGTRPMSLTDLSPPHESPPRRLPLHIPGDHMPEPPNTFTDYQFMGSNLYNVDIYIQWQEVPDPAARFAALQFGFEGGVGGYMGLQTDSWDTQIGQRKAVFSIWDLDESAGDTAQPASPGGKRFDHEGTGAHYVIPYEWKARNFYRLRIWYLGDVPRGTKWGCWVRDMDMGVERMIGQITVTEPYGRLATHGVYWVEHYSKDAGICECQQYSRINWLGPYADGSSKFPVSLKDRYTTCPHAIIMDGPSKIHESGRGINRETI